MQEIWKQVKGYEGFYEISNKGRIRSVSRKVKHRYGGDRSFPGRMITPYIANGYPKVDLYRGGKRKKEYVHRLVAEAFIPNLEGLEIVNHIDGNKENPKADNLEWVTPSENGIHAFDIGIKVSTKGEQHGKAILTESDVREIRKICDGSMTHEEIGKLFGVSKQTIWGVVNNRTWRHVS